jgi:hypothetical protein
VRGDDVRGSGEQSTQVPGEVGVPRVRVHDVCALTVLGDRDVDPERLQSRVGRGQFGQIGVCRCAGFVARCAETADLNVDVATVAQGSDELSHMHPRASVDGGRIFLADDVDAHGSTVVIEALARQWQAQRGSPVSSAAAYP